MTPLSVPDAILRRRATPRFDPARPLDDALLARILALAAHAPSGYNLQPWRFLVVRSAKNREVLKRCAYGQAKVGEAPVVVIVLGHLHPHRSHLDAIVAEQLHRGLVTADEAAALKGRATATMERRADPALWATRSAMLAAATLMLAAESLGVQSAPMEGYDPAQVRQAFGIPDDHTICCLICLGYAAETKSDPGRLPLDDVCFEEHFGQPWTLGEAGA